MILLENGEKLEELGPKLKIIQKKGLYRFSEDSVLLADFVELSDKQKIVDLGTGSAVIPLLLSERAKELLIIGVEIQKELAELAKKSVIYNNRQETIKIIHADLNDAPYLLGKGKWDIIVSNPPYFPIGRGRINPINSIAIARHEIKCTLEQVINSASKLMSMTGFFYMVHRYERLDETIQLLKKYNLYPVKLQTVATTKNQNPYLFLIKISKEPVS
jgi:tRNA1Val (adenine37-N6)-methyltransferase